jgi:UDP-N-acetyl-2-amino-2-deoxyglucuronate dehydrogenase
MLEWIFGEPVKNVVHIAENNKAAGYLELEKAKIRWFLSLDINDVPAVAREAGKRTFRSITVDGKEIEFSDGFTELHTMTYREILAGKGYGLEDARKSIETVYTIRNAKPAGLKGEYHPMLKNLNL